MTSWKEEFEQFDDTLLVKTISDEEWKRKFNDGYGGAEGTPFLAWSEEFVYFPVCYDGAEWISRVPRNPKLGYKAQHIGG